jgi:signal peptide peptidase SppA
VVELGTGSESPSSKSSGSSVDLENMSDVVSFLLQQQRLHAFGTCKTTGAPMELEVVFLVNSPGGAVSTYGLAAAQLQRLNIEGSNISTTVCVDQFAASGGYMIASQADKLIAAPFAFIGSVGVILEGLNFYELAKRYGVQPLVIKAGDSKNPLTKWGPVSRQDIDQEQSRLVKVHEAFKRLVLRGRPGLLDNLKKVTDGSIYLGREAKDLGLVDAVMTTDEYILERIEAGDRVLRLHRSQQARYPRQLRLSPLDILPHLRAWISNAMVMLKSDKDISKFVSRIVQTGTWVGFVHHLLRTSGKL